MLHSSHLDLFPKPGDPDYLLRILAIGAALLLVTFIIAQVSKSRVRRMRFLRDRDPDTVGLVGNLVYVGILVIGIVSIVGGLGISLAEVAEFTQRIAAGLLLTALTLVAARFVRGRIRHLPYLAERDPDIVALITNVAYVATLLLGILTTLDAVGVDLTAVVTVLGVTGLAVSLALQDVLRNFVAGLYILLEQPFSIGDQIALRDVSGNVLNIELRTTRLRTHTGAQVIVPNSVVMTEVVTNRSLTTSQPYVITVSGGRDLLGADLDGYTSLLQSREAISESPEPEVYIESVEAETASLCLRFWTSKRSAVVRDVVTELERRLPEATITAKAE